MSDRAHALIAPSGAEAMISCAARVLMCAGAGEHMDGDVTVREEGTAAHAVCEMWLESGVMPEVGYITENGVAVTEHMQESARKWKTFIESWCVPPYIEQQMPVPLVPRCFGTPDAASSATLLIRVADFKYGYRPVDVWPNYQLALYAAAVALRDGVPLTEETRVDLTIYQPRAWHRSGPLRTAVVTGAEVLVMVERVAQAAYKALAPEPPATPGQHCRTCSGRARCSALRDVALSDMRADMPDNLPFEFLERELSFLMSQKEMIDAYVSGLQLEVEHHMQRGARSSLFEMRSAAGRLEWIPGREAQAAALADLMGKNIRAPDAMVTPTQAAKLIGSAVDAFARRTPGKKSLARLPAPSTIFRSK